MARRLEAITAYPLAWPAGWTRTLAPRRKHSNYKVDFVKARDEALREVRLLGAAEAVLSSNIPTRRDGLPYARQAEPANPGVALYWVSRRGGKYEQRVIACDSWRTVRENMRAVCLALGALRALERTGASEILERSFQGFAALPAPAAANWRRVLGFAEYERPDEAALMARYRELALVRHPDRIGGSHAPMVELNVALGAARDELKGTP